MDDIQNKNINKIKRSDCILNLIKNSKKQNRKLIKSNQNKKNKTKRNKRKKNEDKTETKIKVDLI
jgi:hypothetical protein